MKPTRITPGSASKIEQAYWNALRDWRLAHGREGSESIEQRKFGELHGFETVLDFAGISYTMHANGSITINDESLR